MRLRSHLWLVGDTQYLPAFSYLAQHVANDLCGAATDAHINLIEYQCWCGGGLGDDDLNGQA